VVVLLVLAVLVASTFRQQNGLLAPTMERV
jgi:hypothetical protein